MRITALVENKTNCDLKVVHGLSLYIETVKHKLLFDLGPNDTLFENADTRGIDLADIDIVIISHGHNDHGGAIERFLHINSKAKIFIQRTAFEPHYGKILMVKKSIGLDARLQNHPQIFLVDGDYSIDDELELFIVTQTDKCYSNANDILLSKDGRDKFEHEQNLIIREKHTSLILGCGHTGIVNIMEKAISYKPNLCVGGYHLYNPINKKTISDKLLNEITKELSQYGDMEFYTCHCTGTEAFSYMSKAMKNLHYLSCGDTIEN